jgi:hypothetical protein
MKKETRFTIDLKSGFSYIATLNIADDDDYGTYFQTKNYFDLGDVYAYFLGKMFLILTRRFYV